LPGYLRTIGAPRFESPAIGQSISAPHANKMFPPAILAFALQ
jgi:hypothetical protein